MIRLSFKFLFIMMLALMMNACDKEHMFDFTKSTGKMVTVSRPITGFSEIHLSDDVDLVIRKGAEYALRVTAGLNLIDGITTEMQGNTLLIRNKNRFNWVRSFKNRYTVEVIMPVELENIYYDGAGDINCLDTLKYDGFTLDCWNGSGDLNMLMDTETSHLNIHIGRCLLKASGKSVVSYVYLNDVGVVDASGLSTAYTFIRSSSTGKAEVEVEKELLADISHTGNIYYSGPVNMINSTVTGSGRLIRR
ncbi:MAG: GIN domain-containing protein [Bacteroidota bacterium]